MTTIPREELQTLFERLAFPSALQLRKAVSDRERARAARNPRPPDYQPWRITVKDAREFALEARKLLREDQDPIEKRQIRRSAMVADRQAALTFEECAAAFIAVKEKEWKNAKHGEQWRTTLATYANPVIGRLLVRDVQQAHILKILEPIWTPRPRPLPACVVASRTCWTTPPPGLSQCGQPSALARPPRQDSGHAEQGGKG